MKCTCDDSLLLWYFIQDGFKKLTQRQSVVASVLELCWYKPSTWLSFWRRKLQGSQNWQEGQVANSNCVFKARYTVAHTVYYLNVLPQTPEDITAVDLHSLVGGFHDSELNVCPSCKFVKLQMCKCVFKDSSSAHQRGIFHCTSCCGVLWWDDHILCIVIQVNKVIFKMEFQIGMLVWN